MRTISTVMSDNLAGMALFLALAFIFTWVAFAKGYYTLPYKDHKGPQISLQDVLCCFFIFIAVYFLVLPLVQTMILAHILTFLLTLCLFILYGYLSDRKTMLNVWKDRSFPGTLSFMGDGETGLITWVIAMPVVGSITYLAEILTSLFFTPTDKEQVAVRFLKQSLSDPATSVVALFSILIVAPFFEEFLFRGLLFSYIRTKLGPIIAIFLSSLIFSLFHFSPSQSIENIALLLTLFGFGSYLGFVYEKTRSLFAPILLHVTFNSISVIRIIFTHV